MTPRIAIPMPTSFDPVYNRANYSAYVEAVRSGGGEPVEVALSLSEAEIRRLAGDCQGIVLPGSPADVEPSIYGQPRDEATAPADVARERVDRALLEEAYQDEKPIFGICFGVQMLNAFLGGTLVQDLAVVPVNHAAGRSVAVAHSAAVARGSLLGGIVDLDECSESDGILRLPINSSHHQAIGIPGAGFTVSARCPQDGVVEAVEAPYLGPGDHFVLGVQWHPERSAGLSASSRALFARLVAEARRWRG